MLAAASKISLIRAENKLEASLILTAIVTMICI